MSAEYQLKNNETLSSKNRGIDCFNYDRTLVDRFEMITNSNTINKIELVTQFLGRKKLVQSKILIDLNTTI